MREMPITLIYFPLRLLLSYIFLVDLIFGVGPIKLIKKRTVILSEKSISFRSEFWFLFSLSLGG